MTYFILFTLFFSNAHEELGHLQCQNSQATLEIAKTPKGYKATISKPKSEFQFTGFQVQDEIKDNQIFDVYSAQSKGLKLKVYRPETKGKAKSPWAIINNITFKDCKK